MVNMAQCKLKQGPLVLTLVAWDLHKVRVIVITYSSFNSSVWSVLKLGKNVWCLTIHSYIQSAVDKYFATVHLAVLFCAYFNSLSATLYFHLQRGIIHFTWLLVGYLNSLAQSHTIFDLNCISFSPGWRIPPRKFIWHTHSNIHKAVYEKGWAIATHSARPATLTGFLRMI